MKRLVIVILSLLSSSFTLCTLAQDHFITDKAYRTRVDRTFAAKEKIIGRSYTKGIRRLSDNLETEALRFLYAYMPLADITDYPLDFHLQNVRASFRAREEMPWGREVPELLFRHFVLPVRVNNEALDSSRVAFFFELRERVRGLSMADAILEVNHWCHERVTYAPSDGRTLSPLACIKNALGRCGEESTLTVAALRSIGIPARQVYTPRWAHTDDNHAWVEAWADGRWYFLGACEPEPVLNLGWFNAPASRAMLMHTRAFGDYDGSEEVMLRTSCFTEINLIDNYGSSARVEFRVTDQAGLPVHDARVDFKIYNYAEFCTVATKYTDMEGRTFLTAGKGDMLVWASKGGRFGYVKASFGKDRELSIKLSLPSPEEGTSPVPNPTGNDMDGEFWTSDTLDIVPPAERVLIPEVPDELQRANKRRLAYEDSLRHAYEATFYRSPQSSTDEKEGTFLVKARGNWQTIAAFMEKHRARKERVDSLLSQLTDKDLRDMPMTILEDNLTAEGSQLCPRVENEMIIHPYKHYLRTEFLKAVSQGRTTEEPERLLAAYQSDPSRLVTWVRDNIRLNPDTRALRIAQTPVGVWQSRLTDTRSRDIFFIALARSLDIEARKDVVTGKVQYRRATPAPSIGGRGADAPASGAGLWVDVDFEATEQVVCPQGTLVLTYEPTRIIDNPKYYSHFTLSRITAQGNTQLLNFEEGQVDMGGGTCWATTFRDGALLDAGTYLLTTGIRLANGSVLASNRLFTIREGETTTLPLVLRQTDTEVSVIGSFDSESTYAPLATDCKAGTPTSILSQTGRGYFVVGIVGVGQEPTNHALRDIAKVRADLDQWARPLLLLFESDEDARKFLLHCMPQPDGTFQSTDYGQLPRHLLLGIDRDGSIRRQIATQMKLSGQGQLPLFIIADTFNRVVFCSEGYTIGLGEQMQWVIGKL